MVQIPKVCRLEPAKQSNLTNSEIFYMAFNPDQARDRTGRWTSEGAQAASDDANAKSAIAGSLGTKEAHVDAAKAHMLAAEAHSDIITNQSNQLDKIQKASHRLAIMGHDEAAQSHMKEIGSLMRVKASREDWANRPNRESLSKRLGGKVALQIKARDGNKCVYCGKAEPSIPPARPVDNHHLDHLVPRVLGGEDTPTNLVTACKSCNSARHDMSVAGWAAYAKSKYGLTFNPKRIYTQAQKPLPKVA